MTPDFTGSSIFFTELACDATTPDPTAWQIYHSTSKANLHSETILGNCNPPNAGCAQRKNGRQIVNHEQECLPEEV